MPVGGVGTGLGGDTRHRTRSACTAGRWPLSRRLVPRVTPVIFPAEPQGGRVGWTVQFCWTVRRPHWTPCWCRGLRRCSELCSRVPSTRCRPWVGTSASTRPHPHPAAVAAPAARGHPRDLGNTEGPNNSSGPGLTLTLHMCFQAHLLGHGISWSVHNQASRGPFKKKMTPLILGKRLLGCGCQPGFLSEMSSSVEADLGQAGRPELRTEPVQRGGRAG